MIGPVQERLRAFTGRLLERHGALWEWPAGAEAGWALLPPEAAAALHAPETAPLSFQSGSEGLTLSLTGDFLERVAPLVAAAPGVVRLRAPELYLKRGDMAEAVGRAFAWLNAKVVVQEVKPARVVYEVWYFRVSLDSEDRWEDVLSVALNAASGASVPLPDPLELAVFEADAEPGGSSSPADSSPPAEPRRGGGSAGAAGSAEAKPGATYDRAVKAASTEVERRAAAFVARMESHLDRDRKRVREYYHALLRDAKARRLRGRDEEALREEAEAKRRAVSLELARKLAELEERYALRARLEPLGLVCADLPALAVHCEVLRKQARAVRTVYWNPLLKKLEPLACSRCGRPIFSVRFTDGDVLPVCSDETPDTASAASPKRGQAP